MKKGNPELFALLKVSVYAFNCRMRRAGIEIIKGSSFSGFDFSGIKNLDRALFAYLDFRKANFRGCSLRHAVFNWADLRGADFRNTDLTGANFSMANLRGIRLRGANLQGTIGLEGEKRKS